MNFAVQGGVLATPNYLTEVLARDHETCTFDLSSNENALGASSQALAAMQAQLSEVWRYPDGGGCQLRAALAAHYHINAEHIVLGAGADELITLLVRIFAGKGDEVLFPQYSFIMYHINAVRVGAVPVAARTHNLTCDVEALLNHISDKTRLIFIANPNNPTGTYLNSQTLASLVARVPSHIVVVIDSAYAEFVDDEYDGGIALVQQYPNVVMLRTFSKIYGLAALRLGWCYASTDIVDLLHRSRNPYNVSSLAQIAGIAALSDKQHLQQSLAHNRYWMKWMSQALLALDLSVNDSCGNFLLVGFGSAQRAAETYQYLLKNNIKTRPTTGYGLPAYLRVTIGSAQANEYLLQTLGGVVRGNVDLSYSLCKR